MCITAASGERNNDLAFAPWMNHLCRCLSTDINVVWCFLTWQEKMKGKNKLVPRLLGITKESVMRVDEKTKDVVQEWPLTTVKRWAASPKSFTLVLCPQLHLECAVIYTSSPMHYLYAECDTYNSLLFPPFFFTFQYKQNPKNCRDLRLQYWMVFGIASRLFLLI